MYIKQYIHIILHIYTKLVNNNEKRCIYLFVIKRLTFYYTNMNYYCPSKKSNGHDIYSSNNLVFNDTFPAREGQSFLNIEITSTTGNYKTARCSKFKKN